MYGLDVLTRRREIAPHAKVVVITADIQTMSKELEDIVAAVRVLAVAHD
jgi:hypothetical protein